MPKRSLMIGALVFLAGCGGTSLSVGTGDSTMSATPEAASVPRPQEPLPQKEPLPQFRDIPIVASDPADPNWRTNSFKDNDPLENIPQIVSTKWNGSEMRVTIRNDGPSILEYFATGTNRVKLFQETLESGQWSKANWSWCGTGMSTFEIAPAATIELVVHFWDKDKHERMLARFTEKGTNRSGLVVLAAEPEE